jgi:hypothetical protein
MASTSSSTSGRLLGLDQSFSRMISLLSNLSPLWITSRVNGGAHNELGLNDLHAQEMGGPNQHQNGVGRPAQAHFGPVRSPLPPCGSSRHFGLEPL